MTIHFFIKFHNRWNNIMILGGSNKILYFQQFSLTTINPVISNDAVKCPAEKEVTPIEVNGCNRLVGKFIHFSTFFFIYCIFCFFFQ